MLEQFLFKEAVDYIIKKIKLSSREQVELNQSLRSHLKKTSIGGFPSPPNKSHVFLIFLRESLRFITKGGEKKVGRDKTVYESITTN